MTMVCGISITLSRSFVSVWAKIADTVEYAQYKHNVRKEGIICGLFNFVTKIAKAVGGAMPGIALDRADCNAANVSAEAVSGINFLTVAGAVMFFISLLFIFFYATDEKFDQQIIEIPEKCRQQQISSASDEHYVTVKV